MVCACSIKTTKNLKIYFTTDNHYGQHISYTQFHRYTTFSYTHSTAGYFARKSVSSSIPAGDSWQSFTVSNNRPFLLPQYAPTAFLGSLSHAGSSPTAGSSHERSCTQGRIQAGVVSCPDYFSPSGKNSERHLGGGGREG